MHRLCAWKRVAVVCLAALPLTLGLASTAAAQSAGTSTISGRVTDEKGGVIAGAKVTVRNMDTNVARELATNSDGDYRADFLPPGSYEVTVRMQGFATLKRESIHVEVGATVTLDVTLHVGAVTQEITVTGATPLIEPEKMEFSQVITQTLIENLPINGRRWSDFVLATPGVTTDGGFGLVSYRGISSLYNNNTVDGADNNQAFFSEARGRTRIAYAYSLQTVKEFQVTDSNYSAEFGRSAGGIVNAVTKSGTNLFHGGAFWFLRHFKGNALDSFAKAQTLLLGSTNFVKPERIRNQFGGDFGGPLLKDKLFFYFAYDGSRRSFPGTVTATSGYFNNVAVSASCPPLTLVTSAQCSAAIAFLQLLASPFARTGNQDVYFGKMDYQINQTNHLSGNINWHNWNAPNGYLTGATLSSALSSNGLDQVRSRFVVIDLSSTFHANTANDFRFQYGKDFESVAANGPGPNVGFFQGISYGGNFQLPRQFFPDERRYQFTDTLSIGSGKYTWKMGVDVNLIHERMANLFQGNGNYFYSSSTAVSSPCTNAGAAFAFCNWVLDVYQANTGATTGRHYFSFTQAIDPITGIGLDDFWQNNFGLFVQHTWKILPRLILNLGVRYDVQFVPQPPRPNTSTPLAASLSTRIPIDKNNFGPRVSIGWEVFPKTVIRAGYGIYYGQTSNSTFYTVRVENGVFQQTFTFGSSTAAGAPEFPNVIATPPGPPVAAPFSGAVTPQVINTNPPLASQIVRGLTPDFVNPLVHMGELVIEREAGWNSTVSVSYLFSRGLRLPVFVDANLAPPTTKTYDVIDSTGTTLSTVTLPFYTARSPAGTPGGVILLGKSVVNSWYHGLVVSYNKRFSHGFETIANYTFSKATDTGEVIGNSGTFNGTDTPLDPNNIGAEKALSDLDQRHRFTWSFIYFPPFEHSSSAAVRRAFGGWSFAGILSLASGRPMTPFITGSPNCASGDSGLTCAEVSSFGTPTSGRAPQVGRNTAISPGLTNMDFRVQRDIKFMEKYQLRVLVEAFNLTNTTNVTGVTGTAFAFTRLTLGKCTAALGHTNDCIAPLSATSTQFLTPNSTSSYFVNARQLQLSLRFSF